MVSPAGGAANRLCILGSGYELLLYSAFVDRFFSYPKQLVKTLETFPHRQKASGKTSFFLWNPELTAELKVLF